MMSKFFVLLAMVCLANAGYIGHSSDYSGHDLGSHGAVSSQNIVRHHIPDTHGHIEYQDDHYDDHHEENAYPKYQFKYSVNDPHTEDQKSHWENRDGGAVEGQYTLLQPDGSTRTVTYTADDHKGFEAVVETSGGDHEHHHY